MVRKSAENLNLNIKLLNLNIELIVLGGPRFMVAEIHFSIDSVYSSTLLCFCASITLLLQTGATLTPIYCR